jgi:hypothetical protein
VAPLIALLGLSLVVAGVLVAAWLGLGRQGELLSGLFRAPELGWPRGVQEEDPPPNWGWARRPERTPGDEHASPAAVGAATRPVRAQAVVRRGGSAR